MSTTMTVKGQVTIPKAFRDYLKLAPGDRVEFAFTDDGAVSVAPVRKHRASQKPGKFAALVGIRGKGGRTADIMELLRGYSGDKDDPGFR